MEIQATLTRKKYAKLLLILLSRRSSTVMVGATFIVLLLFSLYMRAFLYLTVIYLLGLILIYGSVIFYKTRKSDNKYYFLTKEYHFNNQGVFVKTPVGNQQLKWEAFTNWRRISDFFILYITNHTYIVIPQSDIPSQKIREFVLLLRNNIKYKRYKRV